MLSACSAAEEVDEPLIIAVKFMVEFATFFSSKTVTCISNLYVFKDLTPTIPTTFTAYISFAWIQLTSNYVTLTLDYTLPNFFICSGRGDL